VDPLDAGQEREWRWQQGQRGAWTRLTWRGRLAAAVALGFLLAGTSAAAFLAVGGSGRLGAAVGSGVALLLFSPLVVAPHPVTRWMVGSSFVSQKSLQEAADMPFRPGRYF